ncbi:MAG: hypothetical protein U9Q74_10935 [Gemmatimonadota bacterium]|nr:hypothetical protein [Gemmatimonadota bacterium]
MVSRRSGPTLARAFDEVRFGPARTLDLRAGLPSVADATAKAEAWLRDRQVARAGTVLVITGRGVGSPGGLGAIRAAAVKLFSRLRRIGVVGDVRVHTPGSFVIELAPITALFTPRARARQRRIADPVPAEPAVLSGLDAETLRDLRQLAEHSLASLGAPATRQFVEDEMLRQYTVLLECMAPDETDRAGRLRFLVAAARRAFEEG